MEGAELEIREQARMLYDTVRRMRMSMIRRVSERMANDAVCGKPEFTMAQMNCLLTVRQRERLSLKELAVALYISAPSASAMVDRLVEMGAVTRRQSPVDRREVVVSLSESGKRDLDAMEEIMLEGLEDLLQRIGPEYASKWCEVYGRIREVVSESSEGDATQDTLKGDVE